MRAWHVAADGRTDYLTSEFWDRLIRPAPRARSLRIDAVLADPNMERDAARTRARGSGALFYDLGRVA